MSKICCPKGHYYDPAKHTSCPYCGVAIEDFQIHGPSGGNPYGATMPQGGGNGPQGGYYDGGIGKTMPQGYSAPEPIGKTMPKDMPDGKDQFKTVALGMPASSGAESEPVVGWLVCINGKLKGKDFKILAGRNKIGRDASNDIALPSDNTISREEHANIIYDPIGNQFYITQGSSRGLVYLNDQLVMSDGQLKSYDRIKLGTVELLFIGLCGDKFNW